MRFLLYNIRYGTGRRRYLFPWGGYFHRTEKQLNEIVGFIRSRDPDVAGLVEVDAGSYRSGRKNQAEVMAERLGHYHTYASKYGEGCMGRRLPMMRRQGNAFLARDTTRNSVFHYFKHGVKKLVIELELDEVVFFLVHLSLGFRSRHSQLGDLFSLVQDTEKPHIVAGDFNVLWGENDEMKLFLGATGLVSANQDGNPSYPSRKPRRQLDFILHSPEITLEKFDIPDVRLSDHLPLVCDFRL
ncbi:MAG: endonuclease/exonuclease/phosphatase family protein [Kiritimatiellia bacterium]